MLPLNCSADRPATDHIILGAGSDSAMVQSAPVQSIRSAIPAIVPVEIEDELAWLRHRVMRMRTILRFAKDPRVEAGMRELISDAEARLAALEAKTPGRPL
jgi:hypothetical protein